MSATDQAYLDWLLKTDFAGAIVDAGMAAIQIFMWFYMLPLYREAPKAMQKSRLFYLLVSFVLTCLSCGSAIISCISLFTILYRLVPNSADFDQVWSTYNEVFFGLWIRGNLVWNVFIWVSDAVLIYRCYAVWFDKAWVALFPLVIFLANLGVAIRSYTPLSGPSTGYDQLNSADLVLSAILNVTVTCLISGRLLHAHRRLARAIPLAKHSVYLATVAIFVECAAPIAVLGLGVAIVRLMEDTMSVLRADTIMFIGYKIAATLSPQLIIFRVALGRSWATNEDSKRILSGLDLELQSNDFRGPDSRTPSFVAHRSVSEISV